jgi:hypothetical protein
VPSLLVHGEGQCRRRCSGRKRRSNSPGSERAACQDGMASESPGTTRGSPRRSRTAKTSRTSRHAVKSRCAHEWGGWGRLSDDGPGHYNPDLSEGRWGGGVMTSTAVRNRVGGPTQSGTTVETTRRTKGGCKLDVRRRMPGAGLSWMTPGKAPPEKPAFQPYWGKPAVRNDRGDRGNVGIIRSPIRASILPACAKSLSSTIASSPA